MKPKVSDIQSIVNEFAPFESALSYDNVGLLAGHPDWTVDTILVALDLTMGAVIEAKEKGAQLILTHHPILFNGRKNVREDDAEGAAIAELIRSHIAMIAAHTNFDVALGGVSDVLAAELGLLHPQPEADGLIVIGDYAGTLRDLEWTVRERVNPHARVYGRDKLVLRVAVCGGAGGDFYELALKAGADAFVTGEVKHHEALAAVGMGMPVIDAGHYETEHLAMNQLAHSLQNRANALQYNVRTIVSEFHPFR